MIGGDLVISFCLFYDKIMTRIDIHIDIKGVNMSKVKAPLFEKLLSHYQSNPVSFHVPGHKTGQGFPSFGKKVFQDLLKIDMTEISGLDDLHQPNGVILEAEKKAASLFKADQTFFLVNGSTAGNLAMILATCQPGDKIIVQRNVHKSVIHGMILARAVPVYIDSEMIPSLGIPGSISLHTLKEVLKNHSDAKAIFLMNPNYYGIGIDLTEIINLAHLYQIPVLVDEAHGAHFGFHPDFPKSAIQMGADVVVQSTHKMLSAMTMGSMLHVKGTLIEIDRLKFFLSMVQSSSPSYPIMASLDLARQGIEEHGETLWKEILLGLDWFLEQTHSFQSIRLHHRIASYYYQDPLKLIIHGIVGNISGFVIQELLEEKGIYPELSDLFNTLLITSYGTTIDDLKRLLIVLKEIEQQLPLLSKKCNEKDFTKTFTDYPKNKFNESKVSLEQILYGRSTTVPLEQAAGKIAAEMVIPYPPGIPVVQLGEEMTQEMINYLIALKNQGAKFQGVLDHQLKNIKVLEGK